METGDPAAPASPPRVLIADADPVSAAQAQALLVAAGYDVTMATTGPEALHYAEDACPDLFIIDRDLPELDGLRVAGHLQRSYHVPLGRILLLDGTATGRLMHPQMQAVVLRKPFTGVELLLAVMRQLEQVGEQIVARMPRRRGRPRKGGEQGSETWDQGPEAPAG